MKLAAWAKANGLTYLAAWKRYKAGTLPVRAWKGDTGAILVDPATRGLIIYLRVDSEAESGELKLARENCERYCNRRKWRVEEVIEEIGDGHSDERTRFLQALDSKPTRIVTWSPDMLSKAGSGIRFLERLLPQAGCELVYVATEKIIPPVCAFTG
jgi:putative resolvase